MVVVAAVVAVDSAVVTAVDVVVVAAVAVEGSAVVTVVDSVVVVVSLTSFVLGTKLTLSLGGRGAPRGSYTFLEAWIRILTMNRWCRPWWSWWRPWCARWSRWWPWRQARTRRQAQRRHS